MPTDVDVERMRQAFGVPQPGQIITYRDIEDLLKVRRETGRFRSVTTAWRKRLDREHNVSVKAIPNVGYEARDSHARVDYGTRTYKGGLRRIGKAAMLAVRTDRSGLDPDEVRALTHIATVGAQLRLMAATEARKLRAPEPEVRRLTAVASR